MSKTKFFIVSIIIAVTIASCQSVSIEPSSQSYFPATFTPPPNPTPYPQDFVHLIWFYKPPDEATFNTLPHYFDRFIFTHKDEAKRDQLKSMGVDSPIIEYLLLAEVMDPGSCDAQPYGNQVAYEVGDFCKLSEEHPDWFLTDTNGKKIYYNDNFVFMDPGNQGFREFWLERARALQDNYNWDGIFLDNAEGSLNKFRRLGVQPAKYADDAAYQAAFEEFLSYIYQNYFHPQGKLAIANIVSMNDFVPWFRYQQYLDGAMLEDFAMDWSTGYLSPSAWDAQLTAVEEALAANKRLILISQGDKNDLTRQNFAFGSYLLVNNGNAAFRYADADDYGEFRFYGNYRSNIGIPLGLRYKTGNTWRRDFSNGYVIVDPAKHTAEIFVNQ
jgi:hypothetical protein